GAAARHAGEGEGGRPTDPPRRARRTVADRLRHPRRADAERDDVVEEVAVAVQVAADDGFALREREHVLGLCQPVERHRALRLEVVGLAEAAAAVTDGLARPGAVGARLSLLMDDDGTVA